jgi:hypothetical protein
VLAVRHPCSPQAISYSQISTFGALRAFSRSSSRFVVCKQPSRSTDWPRRSSAIRETAYRKAHEVVAVFLTGDAQYRNGSRAGSQAAIAPGPVVGPPDPIHTVETNG